MKHTLHRVAMEIGVTAEDLSGWIDRKWVLPSVSCGQMAFDDEAMPVVLDLLDRLHAARAQLRNVLEGVAELPESAQGAVLRRIKGEE